MKVHWRISLFVLLLSLLSQAGRAVRYEAREIMNRRETANRIDEDFVMPSWCEQLNLDC